MALGKSKHYRFKDVLRRHFNSTAALCFRRPDAEELIEQLLQRTPAAIDNVARKLPPGFPGKVRSPSSMACASPPSG